MKYEYHILLSNNGTTEGKFNFLQEKYPLIKLHFYKDERILKNYTPSIQIHLLSQHFTKHAELANQVFMLIDSDICFTDKELNIDHLLDNDTIYMSDTSSYLEPKYLDSKGDDLLACMCSIARIDEKIVRNKSEDHGGAQYLMKNIDATFWQKVEKDSNVLYKYLCESVPLYEKKWQDSNETKYHPVQAWTASMWAILYNLIYFNRDFKVCEELAFCWPGNDPKNWQEKSIFHNAGVTSTGDTFYKGEFINKRPTVDLEILNKNKCSFKYAELVKTALAV